MTKKIVALALAVILFVSCLPLSIFSVGASEDDSITATLIYVESTHSRPGEYVDVNVNIMNNPGIAGAKFSLSFDEDLTLVSIAEDTGVFKALDFTAPENLSGTIIFTWDSLDEVSSTDGTILTLRFKVAEDATADEYLDINISHNYGDIYNTELDSVTVTTVSGRLLVIDYIPGDVNGDGVLNGKDVTLIRRYNAGLTNDLNLAAADVNDDGVINGKDVTLIRRYNANWEVELQPSTPKCNHSLTAVKAKEATCTEAGNVAYWSCSKCEKYFIDEAATIEISLEETIIAAKGHTEVIDEAVPPTYDSTGLTEGSHCSVCGTVILAQQELPKKTKQTITYNDYKSADIPLEYWSYGSDEGLTLPEIQVEGYRFIGWSETKQLRMYKEDADIPSDLVVITSIDKGSTKDYKLYAHFMLNKYTITMRDLINDTKTIEYTIEDSFEIPSPEWSGLLFAYWQDTSNKLVTYLDAVGKQRAKVEKGTIGDFEIIAKWRSPENLVVPKKSNAISASGFDEVSGNYWFFYELGEIQNVILDSIITPQRKTANYTPKFTLSQTFTIEQEKADEISSIISEIISNSESWGKTTEWAEKLMAEGSISIKTGVEATLGKEDVASAKTSLETTVGISLGAEVCDGGSTSSDESREITNEESNQINSSFSYKTTESVSEGLEYTIPESAPNGTYRYVHAADISVYAIIIYDPETQTFVLDSHSVIDQTVAVLLFERDDYVEYAEETLDYNIQTDDLERLIDTAYFIQYAPMEGEGEIATTMHSINQDSKISNQDFKRIGYTQTGWTICKADGTEIEYKLLGANIHNLGLPGETLIAKPVWRPNTYTITYAGNGANGGSTASSNHTYDVSQALTANGFTRAYTVTYNHNGSGSADSVAVATWTFKEWYDEKGITYKDKASVLNLTSTDGATITMTALWNPASVTLPNPTRTGYTFAGWYNEKGEHIGNAGDIYIPDSDITLYAKWNPNHYYIVYNGNGATGGGTESTECIYDGSTTYLSTNGFSRQGYVFDGWNTKADGSGTRYLVGQEVYNWSTGENITLYAIWAKTEASADFSGRTIELGEGATHDDWINTGFSKEALLRNGYTSIEVVITFDTKREDLISLDKVQLAVVGNGHATGWDAALSLISQSWTTFREPFTIDIATHLNDDGSFTVHWEHLNGSGNGEHWFIGTTTVTATAK